MVSRRGAESAEKSEELKNWVDRTLRAPRALRETFAFHDYTQFRRSLNHPETQGKRRILNVEY